MRNNESQFKAMIVEFDREGEMDNKDIAEVELTGCQGQGEGRAQMAASFVIWVLAGSLCHPLLSL